MRTLLALFLSWLLPSNGKRRAAPEQPSMVSTAQHSAGVERPLSVLRSPRFPEFLRGEDVPLIRPYLIAYERAHGIYHEPTHGVGAEAPA
ncbi:hypothetical protein [Streptomyces sp. CC219B]|uniref:hypothetical protein n=1 Tax=Streptomyces sp. CC219B TaxID=3044574 RepID=UPI0024A8026F|nr:hypothetical protein [Streptomyces sp. CC219B]